MSETIRVTEDNWGKISNEFNCFHDTPINTVICNMRSLEIMVSATKTESIKFRKVKFIFKDIELMQLLHGIQSNVCVAPSIVAFWKDGLAYVDFSDDSETLEDVTDSQFYVISSQFELEIG